MKRDKDKFFNIRQCMLVATEGDAWKVWAKVRPVERLLATGDKNVFVSEHCFGGGRCGLLVVNNSGHPYAGMPTLRKGWRVGSEERR